MWIIVKNKYAYYFRHRILAYICMAIYKIKGYEVEVLKNDDF